MFLQDNQWSISGASLLWASTFAWAGTLATAAAVAVQGAYAALSRVETASAGARLAIAYGAAFIAFKAVILLCALGLGGAATTLDPAIMSRQFLRNGAILIGLFALCRGLGAIGVPAAQQRFAPA